MGAWLNDRYELLDPLGAGGEGTVFRARDHRHERTVALKIRPVGADRARILAEAGVLLSLDAHPLLPVVRDDFFDDGRYVIVMDWVDGVDLGTVLREQGRPGLPLSGVLGYLAQAAEALTHLHTHAPPVVHGDVKPGNLVLTRGGRVVLVDFGISTRAGRARGGRAGTSGFVAPEIAAGAPPGPAADVYSLAATAHALLLGGPPSGSEPGLEGLPAAAAAAVRDALGRGLALDPARRPAGAGELVERLRAGWHSTLPTGTSTFLVTEVVGSASLWDASPRAMSQALVRHDALVARAVERAGGRLVQATGESDSTVSVFSRAGDGLRGALDVHAALAVERWPEGLVLRIRSALHTGEADLRDGRYVGGAVSRAGRLRALAGAGELLLSQVTAELVGADLPPGVGLVEVGPHALRTEGRPELVHAVAAAHLRAPRLTSCPYRGLAPFAEDDAGLFFGRAGTVAQALSLLGEHPLLVVVGASGSGKSSLLAAGIVPAVRGGGLPGRWRVAALAPGPDPLGALGSALDAAPGGDGRLLLLVDQLEELFSRCPDPAVRTSFVEAALGAADAAILALRADFYGHCTSIPALHSLASEHQLLLGAMSADELRETIEGPAREVGLELDAGLPELLVSEVLGEPGALSLLSHALAETWERREARRLTIAGYRSAGGARGAIAATAEATFARLSPDGRRLARRVFLRLVEPGEATGDTRRRATLAELATGDAGPGEVTRVLEELARARLVAVHADGVEVAHEALIREWPRLRGWIEEDRERLRSLRHLTRAAEQWRAAGRDAAELYRGARLAAAERLDERELAPLEREFLVAGREAADRERRELRGRIAQQARANRRLRLLLAGTAVLLAVALVSGSVAVLQRRRADRETRVARAADRVAAEQLAAGLAASALGLRDTNPFLATMLATEALAGFRPPLAQARGALVESRLALAGDRLVPYGDPIPVGDALDVTVRRQGDLAATGDRDGTGDLWSLARRERVGRLRGPRAGLESLAFTGDGRWLVGGSFDHRVWRWRVPAHPAGDLPVEGTPLADVGALVWAVAAAPRGSTVAAATETGRLWLLDAATRRRLGAPLRPDPRLHFAGFLYSDAFSPDGRLVLAGGRGGRVLAWSLASRRPRFAVSAPRSSFTLGLDVRRRPAPPAFVGVDTGGRARLWDLRTGTRLRIGPFDAGAGGVPRGVNGVTFGPRHDVLELGGPDGAVYSWSLSRRRLVAKTSRAHRGPVRAAARSGDGLTLVTLGDDHTLQMWTERSRPGPVRRLARLAARPTSLAVAPGGRLLAVGAADGALRLLDASSGRERLALGRGQGAVSAVAFDGPARVVEGTAQGTLEEWDVRRGRLLARRTGAHRGAISALALASRPGARPLVLSAGTDGVVRRWSAGGLAPAAGALGPLASPITDLAVDPRTGAVGAATEGGDVAQWPGGGRPPRSFHVTGDTVWALAYGPRDTLATAAADEVVTLWRPAAGGVPRRAHALTSHRGGALDVAYAGPWTIAVGSADGRLRLWDAPTGAAIGPPLDIAGSAIRHVAAAPGGNVWAAGDGGEIVRVDALSGPAACALAAASFDRRQESRVLAGRRPRGCRARA